LELVRVLGLATQLVEAKPIESVRVPPLGRRLAQDIRVTLNYGASGDVKPVGQVDGDHSLALEGGCQIELARMCFDSPRARERGILSPTEGGLCLCDSFMKLSSFLICVRCCF